MVYIAMSKSLAKVLLNHLKIILNYEIKLTCQLLASLKRGKYSA